MLLGITNNPIQTLGEIKLEFLINNKVYMFPFQIVPDNFPIESKGIAGSNFLKKFQAIINYESNKLVLNNTVFQLYIYRINANRGKIYIPPRCEMVVPVGVTNNIAEGILEGYELIPGVYYPSCILKVINNISYTTILNTTENEISVKNLVVSLSPINEGQNVKINAINSKCINRDGDNRIKNILNSLRLSHLNNEEKDSMVELITKYPAIFHIEGDDLTSTSIVNHEIHTKSNVPTVSKIYRYPHSFKEIVQESINDLLSQKIIKPSASPWNSPVWVVPKKLDASGKRKFRLVIDYRKLNEATIGDSYPLPNITDILDQLGHSKYFSTLDLASGYHQIDMHPSDAEKTAFSVPFGHYEFNRMPFGLKNAPATFQRLMNNVLTGLQGNRCFVYLDDIVIFADTLENHNKKLTEIFDRLQKFNLKLKPEKCEFLRKEVIYLGHKISENGAEPDEGKIEAVKNFPVPKNIKDIKSFLGLTGYYRKFIDKFSDKALPLTSLLKKCAIFRWDEEQQKSFNILKSCLINQPILQFPDFSKPFNITTDASNYAIGAVLSQGQPPSDLPIAYASRCLNSHEINYSTIEKESLAVVWAVKHFRPYVYGKKFRIFTDHQPLVWLFNVKDPNSRLVRWRLMLEEYDYEIIYKPGRVNSNADALSRNPVNSTSQNEIKIISNQNPHKIVNRSHISRNENTNHTNKSNKTKEKENKTRVKNESINKRLMYFKKPKEMIPKNYLDFNVKLMNGKLNTFRNNNLINKIESISDAKNNIICFITKDMKGLNNETNQMLHIYNHRNLLSKEEIELGNVFSFKGDRKTIYYLVVKENLIEKVKPEILFQSLGI